MQIRGGIVLNGTNNRFERLDIRIENGKISLFGILPMDGEDYDASGMYVIPGFIDTHIHGTVGVEFASANERFDKARSYLATQGVTTLAPTVRALSADRTVAAIKNIVRESKRDFKGTRIGGIHLEGPFVAQKYKGAMNPPDVDMSEKTVARFISAGEGLVKIITIAPELSGADGIIKYMSDRGVHASIGHTNATFDEAKRAIECGADRVTHLFNAMRPLSHRDPGVLTCALADERLMCELICDFVHVDPAVVSMALRCKGSENVTLVSDNGFMSGLGDGVFNVDGRDRYVTDGVCRTPEGKIAGSTVSILAGAKNLLSLGVPLEEISKLASANPAKALGIDSEVGSVTCGRYADLIVTDGELNIKAVFVGGVRVA